MIPEDAVTKAEVEAILIQIRRAKDELIRVERETGGCRDLCGVIVKLDEVVRKLTAQ
jgi:hypothetical protein